MKVAFDKWIDENTGMGNYTEVLIKRLPVVCKDVDILVINHKTNKHKQNLVFKLCKAIKKKWFKAIILPWTLITKKVDVFHNTLNIGGPYFYKCKYVTTIHDIIPHMIPDHYLKSWYSRLIYEFMIRKSISKSGLIITISEFSKNDLIKYYKVPEEKIRVIPQACSDDFRVLEPETVKNIQNKYEITRPYIMTMGGSEYRKNVRTIIEAYKRELYKQFDLIVIGSGSWNEISLEKEYKEVAGLRFMEDVSRQDLIALYNGAEVFVFASMYEGFGLPLLEAMNCGTPVVASVATCMKEVAGDAALYFETMDKDDLESMLIRVINDKALRQDMVQKGFDRVKIYSWDKTVQMTYDVYKEVLAMK